MKPALGVALLTLTACAPVSRLFHSSSPRAESLYWDAIVNLDDSNKSGTLDTALAKLDAYLATPGKLEHLKEAQVLRTLARNSQQLARMEATLEQTRATAPESRPRETDTKDAKDTKARDDESVKEIQRLKDELAAANAELERIKKRLGTPPPTKP